jgi:hypothetical protein
MCQKFFLGSLDRLDCRNEFDYPDNSFLKNRFLVCTETTSPSEKRDFHKFILEYEPIRRTID